MDERPYFAHSANQGGTWHRLCDHLGSVATIARTRAGSAPWAAEANLAGLLHDIGKYGDLFQGRLRGEQAGIDHWSLAVLSPTVFRHDCLTFTHLATGYAVPQCPTRRIASNLARIWLLQGPEHSPTIAARPGTKFGFMPCGLRVSIRRPYIPGPFFF
jgi:hypothetical protein